MKTLLIAINSKYIHPAMGVYQLVANVKEDETLDYKEFTIKDDINEIINFINNFDANLIGFSCYIWNIEYIKKIIKKITKKTIFLGGPEASFNPNLLLEYDIDFIIKNEGEEAFNELLNYLEKKITIDKVSNLYYKENNEIKYTYDKLPNLDNVKHDLSLIKDYENRICYLESSRGCYYTCSYCLAATEKPVRFFPIDEVKNNILFLLNNKAKIIKFLDRSFNVKKEYINDLLLFIKKNDNNYTTFQFEINGDNLNNDTIEIINNLRKKSIRFEIGIQTTNPIVSKAILRHQDFDKLKNNILKIRDNTVIHTDLIAGLPFETYESFKNSFNETFLLFTEELQLGFLKELKGTFISKTKDLHNYVFMEESPFEVIENKYITNEELNKIKLVEKGVDKFYNYGYFKETMNYLFNTLKLDPFETFKYIISYIENIKEMRLMQFDELTNNLYLALSNIVDNTGKLFYIIKKDYLTKTKIKPKIFWNPSISREERKMIYELFKNQYNLNIDELYKYAHLEKYENNYFLINYKTQKTYEINKA